MNDKLLGFQQILPKCDLGITPKPFKGHASLQVRPERSRKVEVEGRVHWMISNGLLRMHVQQRQQNLRVSVIHTRRWQRRHDVLGPEHVYVGLLRERVQDPFDAGLSEVLMQNSGSAARQKK